MWNAATVYGINAHARSYTGSVTPGYAGMKKRQRVKLPCNSHSVTIIKRSGTGYSENHQMYVPYTTQQGWTAWNGYNETYIISDCSVFKPAPLTLVFDSPRDKARARLAKNFNDLKFNAAQAFAERRQTAGLISSTASRIAAAALALRRGRLGDLEVALSIDKISKAASKRIMNTPKNKRVASHWLELQYGWKPLLQDVSGAAELLAKHVINDHSHTSATGSFQVNRTRTQLAPPNALYGPNTTSVSQRTKFRVDFALDSAARSALAQTGISNPALLAWELLPYSFVVDWFIPVGNYLQSLDDFSGFSFVGGYESTLTITDVVQSYTGGTKLAWNGALYEYTTTSGSAATKTISYNRTKLTSFPLARPPEFKNPLGGNPLQRMATAMSLLRVLFK